MPEVIFDLDTPADTEGQGVTLSNQNDTDALAHANAAADSAARSQATADSAAVAANQAQSAASEVKAVANAAAATHAKAVADITAASTEAKAAADTAKAAAAKAADAANPADPSDSHFYKYAGLYTFGVLLMATILWLCYLPRRSAYPPTPERELCAQLADVEKFVDPRNTGDALLSGCPRRLQEGIEQKRVSFVRVAQSDLASSTQEGKNDPIVLNRIEELSLSVWNRYEEEFSEFRYGKDLNWYMHASLMVLSAITPALIVAPLFAKKKFLAALPAAIVAIGTACISEFDFKTEAASYGTALVEVLGEKTAFITRFDPTYNYLSAQSEQKPAATSRERNNSDKSAPPQQSGAADGCTDGHVPFPKPELLRRPPRQLRMPNTADSAETHRRARSIPSGSTVFKHSKTFKKAMTHEEQL